MKSIPQNSSISLDADGVILDFNDAWEAVVERVAGGNTILYDVWDLGERYGLSQDQLKECWRIFDVEGVYRHIKAYEGAAQWINEAIDVGYDVHIVTSINPSIAGLRIESLHAAGVDTSRISLHCAGLAASKREIFNKIRPVMHVDDHSRHLSEARDAGVPVRVLHQGFMHDAPVATHRISSLSSLRLEALDRHLRHSYRPFY